MMNFSSGGDRQDAASQEQRLDLSPQQAAALFPFHVIFDQSLCVMQVGKSLAKVITKVRAGVDLREHLEIERPKIPFDFDSITANLQIMYLLRAHDGPLRLRGQMVRLGADKIAFLCSPWVPEPGALRKLGLLLSDFPLHDPMPELVNVVQSQRFAMEDLRRLTEKLRTQRQSLRDALDLLQIREAESRRLAMIAARTENSVIVTDTLGRVEWVNDSFEKLTGYKLAEVRGRTPGSFLQGPGTDPATVAYMRERLRVGQGFQCEIVNYSKSGRRYWLSVEVQPIHDEAGSITNYMAIESDITSRKDYELRSHLAYSVRRILAESTDAAPALQQILAVIAEGLPCRFGALWRVDAQRGEIYCQHYWADPQLLGCDFEASTNSTRFVKGAGLPGTVWQSNAPVWLPDLGAAVNFPRSAAARSSGLKSGFAFPIRLGGQIRGVMEFFSDLSEEPSAGILETLIGLGGQLEQFLERREAEHQRGEILSLLDSTLESSAEGIMVTDAEGRPLRVNRRWVELWSVPDSLAESLDRDELFRWIDAQLEDPEARRKAREELFRSPKTTRTDVLTLKDGRVLEILSTPHRMFGEVSGRLWTYRDITEAHKSQRVREELLATLNATLEATADGISVADLQGKLITTNKRFAEMWRIPEGGAGHWRGSELRQFVSARLADPEVFIRRVQWFCDNPEESGFDIVHFLDSRVYEQHTQPQRVGERVTGRVWSYRDVTERWRADQALRDSEERYRVVMHSASDAIVTVDEKGFIVFASRSAGRLFGFPPEDLPGMLIWRLVPPEYRGIETVRGLLRIGSKHGPRGLEVEALRKDGSRLPVEMSLHRSRIGGRKFVTGVLRDITMRKAAERHLQEAILAAEYANKAKSDFLANISHEMRTPLNSIVGLTELLRTSKLDTTEQEEMLASVWTSSESLLHLINDLLDLSKIEAGQVDIESVEFDAASLGEQVIEILRLRAARKGLTLYFVVHPVSPPRLVGDVNRIRQILINLMGNAIKFTERGSITLRFEWSATDGSSIQARFVAEDTGIGIPAEDQERVFDKFFRVNTAVGRRAGGAGLGLSISRLLCEAMGGKLSLNSTSGVGSQFALNLTFQSAGARAIKADAAPLRALFLTANETEAQIRAVVASAGLAVDAFSDVPTAIAHADQSAPYDIFILDEQAGADADQLRFLLRLSMLGKDLRSIRIRKLSNATSDERVLPGRSECLESPFTPARVARAVAVLTQNLTMPPEAATRLSREGVEPPAQGASVLLVEDNPDSQAYALRVLAGAGHRTTVAGTGSDAIAEAQRRSYDVILMDVMLPDMTGFEATRSIRGDELRSKRRRTPVIALTAHALQDYRREAFTADMDDYLTKPVRPQALLDAVKTWTSTSRPKPDSRPPDSAVGEMDEVTVDADLLDLIPSYLESVNHQLRMIREHAEAGRLADAARLGHNLKGTGDSYGFGMVTIEGGRIEEAAKAGNRDRVIELASGLGARLSAAKWKSGD